MTTNASPAATAPCMFRPGHVGDCMAGVPQADELCTAPCQCHGCRFGNDCIGEGSAFWTDDDPDDVHDPSDDLADEYEWQQAIGASGPFTDREGVPSQHPPIWR